MVSDVEAPRGGAPSAHAPGDASVSTSGGFFVSGPSSSLTERKNALAASAYVGQRLVSRAKDTRRRVKERDKARSLGFGGSEARIRAHGGGKPPDDAAPTAEGNEDALRPPRPPVGDRPLGIARSDDPDRVTRRVAAYGNPKISARRAVLRWRAHGAATKDTADGEDDEPRPTEDSDSDVVVPRPPASPSRPGFKSQVRRVVIASRFVRRAREAADLDISPRPGPPPTRLESLPPESPSAPSPRVDDEAAPADEVPEESDVDATSSCHLTPREDGIPEDDDEEENIPVESLASEGDGSPRARAYDVVRKLRDAANELSKTPRAERDVDAVRDAVARAVDASAMESQRMARLRASAPDAPRVPSPPRDARPEGGAVGRAAAMLKKLQDRRRKTEEKNELAESAYAGKPALVLNEAEERAKLARGLPGAGRDRKRRAAADEDRVEPAGAAVSVAAVSAPALPLRPEPPAFERARSDALIRANLRAAAYGGGDAASARARRIAGMKPHVEIRSGGDAPPRATVPDKAPVEAPVEAPDQAPDAAPDAAPSERAVAPPPRSTRVVLTALKRSRRERRRVAASTPAGTPGVSAAKNELARLAYGVEPKPKPPPVRVAVRARRLLAAVSASESGTDSDARLAETVGIYAEGPFRGRRALLRPSAPPSLRPPADERTKFEAPPVDARRAADRARRREDVRRRRDAAAARDAEERAARALERRRRVRHAAELSTGGDADVAPAPAPPARRPRPPESTPPTRTRRPGVFGEPPLVRLGAVAADVRAAAAYTPGVSPAPVASRSSPPRATSESDAIVVDAVVDALVANVVAWSRRERERERERARERRRDRAARRPAKKAVAFAAAIAFAESPPRPSPGAIANERLAASRRELRLARRRRREARLGADPTAARREMDDALAVSARERERERAERRRELGEWARLAALEERARIVAARNVGARRRETIEVAHVRRGPGAFSSEPAPVSLGAAAADRRAEAAYRGARIKPPRKRTTRRTRTDPPPRAPSPEEVAYTTDFETADATTEAEEMYTTDFDVDDEDDDVVGPIVEPPPVADDATNEATIANDVVEPLPDDVVVVPDLDAMDAAARAIDAALDRAMEDVAIGEAVDAALDETVALVARWNERRDLAAEKRRAAATLDERLARGFASLEARARAEEASAAAREAEERERAEREPIVAALVADRIERITRAERRRRMEARAAVRAILDEYVVVPAVATVEEPDLKRRIAILRAKNEALRARLAWERKLEFTPRGVLRRTPFGPEELAIIRSIEPALAVRTVKDPSYDPFKNGYDLTWMRPDWKPPGEDEDEDKDDAKEGSVAAAAEAAERERDGEPRAEKAGAFAPAPPIALGHAAADARASSAYAPEQHQHHQHRHQHQYAVSETRRSPPSTSPRPPRASAARRRLARLAAKRSPPDAVRSPAEDGLGFIDALIDDAVDDAVREEEEEETRAAARDASRRIEDAAEKDDDDDDGSPRSPLQERSRYESRYEVLPKHLRKSLA